MAARMLLLDETMSEVPRFDVSVIMPFGDDEEAVGVAVRRTAEHLRGLALRFEILAIDEDSGDNSGFYRFQPDAPGALHEGGTLEMLAVVGRPGFDTRTNQTGEWLDVDWVPIGTPDGVKEESA